MESVSAQIRMKALVVARLLLGDINDWQHFEKERDAARTITNRHAARSVSSQIGRNYRDLSAETKTFIAKNFSECDYQALARLCDGIESGVGLYLRLDDFEKSFFPLAEEVKRRFPFYAHVSISIYGLQFEYPEHHFISDIEAAFEGLKDALQGIRELGITEVDRKNRRGNIASIIGREKFISRSLVSASFSLVEAYLSGLLFTALNKDLLGSLRCDEALIKYARTKESAALKDRVDRVVKFASRGEADGRSEPFKSFIEIGKRYRDAIHHTTPFERKDIEAGQRLLALYEIKADVALLCAILALDAVSRISRWLYGNDDQSVIARDCTKIRNEIMGYSLEQGFAKAD